MCFKGGREVKVKDFMRTKVEVANPDMSLEEALGKMRERSVKSLVVVDKEGEVQGIITDSDILLRGAEKGDPTKVKVSEVMTENPFCISPEEEVLAVISVMRERKFRRVPVVEGRKLVGIVSVSDLAPHVLMYLKKISTS
jgi:CBS domain-containing protein